MTLAKGTHYKEHVEVVAVALNHKEFLFECPEGHTFWEEQTTLYTKQPMNFFTAMTLANLWGPGVGCYGTCKTCEEQN
jgi:hypothetical protein